MSKVTFLPGGQEIEIDETSTLREAAHLAGVNVHDRCGGMGACCNCIVTVVQGVENLSDKTIVEQAVFYMEKHERLSCQTRIKGDVTLEV